MFKPSKEKSEKTKAFISKIFSICHPGEDFTLVYAYNIKQTLFSKKRFFYVIGFNEYTFNMIIIPITDKGEILKKVRLNKRDIRSAKYRMQSQVCLKTTRGSYTFFVPPYTPTTLEQQGVMPIVQEKESIAFHKFINIMN